MFRALFHCFVFSLLAFNAVAPARGDEPPNAFGNDLGRQIANVLVLGDDVMEAYRGDLVKLLHDKAECTFVAIPATGKVDWAAFCDEHVFGKAYDVIHFAYGREAMRHVNGKPVVPRNQIWGVYDSLIGELKKSEAFLIGCTTTPFRGSSDEFNKDVDWDYVSRFQQQLGPNGIKINDLGDFTRTRLSEMVQLDSYLPTKVGAQLMAEQAANNILEALNEGQNPNRPRILIVGDSIVGGYFGATRNQFAGKAIVYSGGTTYNDAKPNWESIVDGYITKGGTRGWDVIQFNWGLHAVKWINENRQAVRPDGPGAFRQFTPDDYAANLRQFVKELKRTKAKLVFATTTPIPAVTHGPITSLDLSLYNDPAKRIMAENGILVNDLHAYALPNLVEWQLPKNVHFSAAGSEQLAKQNFEVLWPLLEQP